MKFFLALLNLRQQSQLGYPALALARGSQPYLSLASQPHIQLMNWLRPVPHEESVIGTGVDDSSYAEEDAEESPENEKEFNPVEDDDRIGSDFEIHNDTNGSSNTSNQH